MFGSGQSRAAHCSYVTCMSAALTMLAAAEHMPALWLLQQVLLSFRWNGSSVLPWNHMSLLKHHISSAAKLCHSLLTALRWGLTQMCFCVGRAKIPMSTVS